MEEKLERFYFQEPEELKACLLAIRSLILSVSDELSETVKYGMPCFTLHGQHLCYLWMEKNSNQPYILFVDGNLLNHPDLTDGGRKRMKTLLMDHKCDLPEETVRSLIREAIDLRRPM